MNDDLREKAMLAKGNEASVNFKKANDVYDIKENQYLEVKRKTERVREHINKLKLDVTEKEKEVHDLQNIKKDLEIKIDIQKTYMQDINLEMPKRKEEVDDLRVKKISLEKDLQQKRDNMIKEFKSYNILCHNYKKFFDCHIALEDPNIIIFEFEKRQESSTPSEFFVKLSTPDEGKTFELLEVHPEVYDQDELAKQLLRTNNVTNLLTYLHKQFTPLLMKK